MGRRPGLECLDTGGPTQIMQAAGPYLPHHCPPPLPPPPFLASEVLRPRRASPSERVCLDRVHTCTHTHSHTSPGFRDTLKCGRQAPLIHPLFPQGRLACLGRGVREAGERWGDRHTTSMSGVFFRSGGVLVNPTSAGSRCSEHFLKRSVRAAFLFSWAAQYELFFPSALLLPRPSF